MSTTGSRQQLISDNIEDLYAWHTLGKASKPLSAEDDQRLYDARMRLAPAFEDLGHVREEEILPLAERAGLIADA